MSLYYTQTNIHIHTQLHTCQFISYVFQLLFSTVFYFAFYLRLREGCLSVNREGEAELRSNTWDSIKIIKANESVQDIKGK